MEKYQFKLYIYQEGARSRRAEANIREICDEIAIEYEIEIIDIAQQPAVAEQDRILATPTLVRIHPEPQRRIIGDLSDREKVIYALDLDTYAKD